MHQQKQRAEMQEREQVGDICQRLNLDWAQGRSLESLRQLQGLSLAEYGQRAEWASTVQRVVDSWFFGFGSPAVAGFLESYSAEAGGATVDTSMHSNIRDLIPDLARTAYTCPLHDVRVFVRSVLSDLKKNKHFMFDVPKQLSPAYAFTVDDLPHLKVIFEEPYEDDPLFTTYALFCAQWSRWYGGGRLENFAQVLGCHPEFLEPFMAVHQYLFTGDLALPYPLRYYLAILAAAEMRCPQLICLFVRYFLQAEGDPSWLENRVKVPTRWLQLTELFHNLAHAPWKVTADDIYQLTRGDDERSSGTGGGGGGSSGCSRGDKLSLSELMQAVGIATHVQALACLVFGASVRPELEFLCPTPFQPFTYVPASDAGRGGPRSSGSGRTSGSGDADSQLLLKTEAEKAEEERLRMVQAKASEELVNLLRSEPEDMGSMTVVSEVYESSYAATVAELDLSQYCEKVHLPEGFSLETHPIVAKFLIKTEESFQDYIGPPFLLAEFSWMEEGSPLVDHLASSLGTLLDEAFKNAFDLTYNTVNEHSDVNTSSLRHSLWFFVQSIFGACHEDMRCERVTKLLTPGQRAFLKVCAARPFDLLEYPAGPATTPARSLFPALSPSEVVHVLIMVMEARKQTCLSYALRAISQCQTRR